MKIPIIEDLTASPLPIGSTVLVEFDPASRWYAASLSIAAGYIRSGGRIGYIVTTRQPDNIRSQFKTLGLDKEQLENDRRLLIYDWYKATLGQKSTERYQFDSMKAADLSIWFSKYMKTEVEAEWLDIVDNYSTMARFNDEKAWVEFTLTRIVPTASTMKETMLLGVVKGVHSEWAYRTLEGAVDGIVDFEIEETEEEAGDLVRIRAMRDVGFDRRWHRLKIGENLEVTIDK